LRLRREGFALTPWWLCVKRFLFLEPQFTPEAGVVVLQLDVHAVQLGDREIRVRGVIPRGDRIRHAVTAAYGEKYNTKASQKWVKGFADGSRLRTTLELVPR
jgi:hypothetical protein